MRTSIKQCILVSNSLLAALCSNAGVYSQRIVGGGESQIPCVTVRKHICRIKADFAPYEYKLDEESVSGVSATNLFFRTLDVYCGSEVTVLSVVNVDHDPLSVNGSGDLAELVAKCVTGLGGHTIANTLPVMPASWMRETQNGLDVVVVEGDHFTEVKKVLERGYGAPDAGIRSTSPEADGRSLVYTPQQIGVGLILSSNQHYTIVSVIGTASPAHRLDVFHRAYDHGPHSGHGCAPGEEGQ